MQNNNENQKTECAGFWVRLAAFCIDNMFLAAGLLIVRLFLTGIMSVFAETPLGGNLIFQYNLSDIVLYLIEAVYFTLFTYYTGTTIGKKAMNLRVVNQDGSTQMSLLNVIYRETIGRFLSGIILWIGYLIIGFDSKKRGLHDILCDTQVIYAKSIKTYEKTQNIGRVIEMPVSDYQIIDPAAQEENLSRENTYYKEVEESEKEDMIILGGYHLTDEPKVDIVDEEKINEDNLL
ncbi:MAG: RDD family protein [Schaedlerella sp.]|nr:RDD family protein [Schaedlerella sp.]